jgi:cell division protease FtsH
VFGGKFTRTQLVLAAVATMLVLAAALPGFLFLRVPASAGAAPAAFSQFLQDLQAGRVYYVEAAGDELAYRLKDGTELGTRAPTGYLASNPDFAATVLSRGVTFTVRPETAAGASRYGAIALGVLCLGLIAIALLRAGGRVPSLERAHTVDPQQIAVTFKDVAGVDEAKDEIAEIVDFLKNPTRFATVGGRIPRGVLLVGPPGTGKTLLARSMAGESGVPFISASGSDFVEMYAGVGAARVRKLFKEARRHRPCIVFIDELDAVGRSRGGSSLSHEEREQTLNQLLVEMDGFTQTDSVIVVAATNRADILDQALLRPGRFDRQVTVGNPDLKGREQILGVHARKVALEPGIDLRATARGTPGFSGADLANLVNEAALMAARAGRATVCASDLDAARDKVLMGVERRSVAMSESERVTCAYHEAGHAVVAATLPEADPLHKVTIVPRGRALGVTMQLPDDDRHTHSKSFLEAQIAILMGGRVAEELFLRQMTSGAANDIERATELARRMVCELGMSPLGPVHVRPPSGAWDGDARATGLSEQTLRRVDEEIRATVMRGYETARQVIDRRRQGVRALAEELLEVESMNADRVADVLADATDGGAPALPALNLDRLSAATRLRAS